MKVLLLAFIFSVSVTVTFTTDLVAEVTVSGIESGNLSSESVTKETAEDGIVQNLLLAKQHIEAGEFQNAIEVLKNIEGYSFVSDIVLYWKGISLMGLSSPDAERTFNELIQRCTNPEYYFKMPCSPDLLKNARFHLIELKLPGDRKEALRLLQQYTMDYPADDYALYLLAYLKGQEGEDVTELYKRLYIRNSSFVKFFPYEMDINILSHEEIEAKINGLMKAREYDEAQRLIKARLQVERPLWERERLLKLLGYVYFRQKLYKEAVEAFRASKEYYMLALSYLRSGDNESAEGVIQKLINSKDRRVVPIAIAYARILRDQNRYDDSIRYLENLLRHFPYDMEQIKWAITWTHYMTGNYEEAFKIIKSLSEEFKNFKYKYWLFRTKEKLKDTKDQDLEGYREIAENGEGIYRVLARQLLVRHEEHKASGDGQAEETQKTITFSGIKKDIKCLEIGSPSVDRRHQNQDQSVTQVTVKENLLIPGSESYLSFFLRRASIFLKLGLKNELSQEITFFVDRCIERSSPESESVAKVSAGAGFSGEILRVTGDESVRVSQKSQTFWGGINSLCYELLSQLGLFYFKTDQPHRAVNLYTRLKSLPTFGERIDDSLLYPVVFADFIMDSSRRYGVDPLLILAIIRQESRYNPDAISPAGARGLMQIMPHTARRLLAVMEDEGLSQDIIARDLRKDSDTNFLGGQIMNPELNIKLGALYLKNLIDRYGGISYALAAYNAGEKTVDSWLKNNYLSEDEFIEDIPYRETINYVKRVLATYDKYLKIYSNLEQQSN